MSRLDSIRRELEVYLSELDAERERVLAFLNGATSVLDTTASPSRPSAGPAAASPTVASPAPQPGRPVRGDAAYALDLMTARTDIEEWDTPQLLAAMQEDGWTTNAASLPNAVSAILSRLQRGGQLERRSRGRYAVPRSADVEGSTAATVEPSIPAPTTPEEGGANGTDAPRVRDADSSRQAIHLDHGFGAPVAGA